MATLNPATMNIPSPCVPSDLDRLDFVSDAPFLVDIFIDDVDVISETLHPDAKGEASLYSLAQLINTQLDGSPKNFAIGIDKDYVLDRTCYPCGVGLNMDTPTFFNTHFLHLGGEVMETWPGSIEYLGFTGEATDKVNITAEFYEGAGAPTQVVIPGKVPPQTDGIGVLEVDVDKIASFLHGCRLLRFTVEMGQRKQTFLVYGDDSNGEHLAFVNTFGVPEHLFIPFVETKMQPEKQQARINGRLQNYDIRRKRTYSGVVKILNSSMEDVFENLLMSKTVYRQSDNVLLVVDSGEVVRSSDHSVGSAAKATWRESHEMAFFQPTQAIRTFDETFDTTFL